MSIQIISNKLTDTVGGYQTKTYAFTANDLLDTSYENEEITYHFFFHSTATSTITIYQSETLSSCLGIASYIKDATLSVPMHQGERCIIEIKCKEDQDGEFYLEVFPGLPETPENSVPDNMEADPVDVSTGSHVLNMTMGKLCGGQNLELTAKYSSSRLAWSSLGKGWSHNYEKSIKEEENRILVYEKPCAFREFTSDDRVNYTCQSMGYIPFILTKQDDGYCLCRGDKETEYYDSTGKLVKIVSRQGFETQLVYDSTGKLSEIIDKVTNQKITLSYEGTFIKQVSSTALGLTEINYQNFCISEILNNGNKTSYTYDSDGRVLTGTDAKNVCFFTNVYDPVSKKVIKQTDALGNETIFNYTDNKCVVTQRDGTTCTREYDSNGLLIKFTDANGNATTYTYNSNGQVLLETDALGKSKRWGYDENFRLYLKVDKNLNYTKYNYDLSGNLTSIEYLVDTDETTQESFTYNNRHQVVTFTDERGTVTRYGHNADGLVSTKTIGDHITYYTHVNGLMTRENDPRRKNTYFTYENGRLKTKTNALSHATNYNYDAVGNLISVVGPLENSVSYQYDCNGQKISETDEKGNITTYEYNDNLKLTKVTFADGGELIHEYDVMDRIIKTTDPEGNETFYLYDPAGRLVCKTLPDGNQYCYIYDAVGNVLEEGISKVELDFSEGLDVLQAGFAAYGKIIRTFDANGNVLTQTDRNGLTAFEYDGKNRMIKKTAANGGITRYTYSSVGELLTVTDPLNHTVTYTYDSYGNKATMTDPKGNVTSYAYDANNNLIRATDVFGSVQYEYDACNQLVKVIDQASNETVYGYDAAGRRTTVTDPAGKTVTTTYDAMGNVLSVTNEKSNVIRSLTYNQRNLPATTNDASGEYVYEYNKLGKVVKVMDANTYMEKLFTYDCMGRLINVTDEDGRDSTATYHPLGKPLSMLGPNEAGTVYTYDDYGRVLTETIATGATKTYTYNAMGLVATVTNARNQVHQYTYDPAGRLASLITPEGTVTYLYDDNGNVLSITDAKGARTYTYDASNRVTSYTDAEGNTIQYRYESRGKIDQITYPDNSVVNYYYDERNNLETVTDWAQRSTYYYYDDSNKLIRIENDNGTTVDYDYDNMQRLTYQDTMTADYGQITGYSWDYDANGRLIQEWGNGISCDNAVAFDHRIEYNYLDSGWLNDVIHENNLTSVDTLEVHSYDEGGNLVQGDRYSYDQSNRLVDYEDYPLQYDNGGNIENVMINNTDFWMTYDSRNRVIRSDGDVIADYEYSPQNLLEKRTVDGIETEYVYDPLPRLSRLLMKTTDDVTTKYVYGLGLIGEEINGSFKTYHYDYRGSTVAITEDDGSIIDTFEYDTYGKLLSHVGETDTPFCYNGRDGVMTEPNGLYYMRNRFYSPDLKRFINPDLIAGDITNAITLNRYAYANNNPIMFVDPLGLSVDNTTKVVIGVLLIGGLFIASAATGGIAGVILGGACAGAVVGGASGAISGALTGDPDEAATGFLTGVIAGGATGALAASGANAAGVAIGNAAINAGEVVLGDWIDGDLSKLTALEAGTAVAAGLVLDGAITKNVKPGMLNKAGTLADETKLYKNAMPKNNNRANRKYVEKNFRRVSDYYTTSANKHINDYVLEEIKGSPKSIGSDVATNMGRNLLEGLK